MERYFKITHNPHPLNLEPLNFEPEIQKKALRVKQGFFLS